MDKSAPYYAVDHEQPHPFKQLIVFINPVGTDVAFHTRTSTTIPYNRYIPCISIVPKKKLQVIHLCLSLQAFSMVIIDPLVYNLPSFSTRKRNVNTKSGALKTKET